MIFPPVVYQCESPACAFRFPVTEARFAGMVCPVCGGVTAAKRPYPPSHHPIQEQGTGSRLSILLDNIRSVHNVGSIVRAADGVGVRHIYFCGITATPDNRKLKKTALGAEQSVAWSYHRNGLATAVMLRSQAIQLWALESTPVSIPLTSAPIPPADIPILLIVGNEVAGVDPAILDIADQIVHLPMNGRKSSLNVSTALTAAVYLMQAGR